METAKRRTKFHQTQNRNKSRIKTKKPHQFLNDQKPRQIHKSSTSSNEFMDVLVAN